nr:MAG TPA: MerR family regulatory protein [Caudoviricetes sp.]
MKDTRMSKDFNENPPTMTLKGYYQSLPLRNAPRYDFLMEVARRCKVTEQTVRNWVLYGVKPQQRVHIEILSELTGIQEEDLWRD